MLPSLELWHAIQRMQADVRILHTSVKDNTTVKKSTRERVILRALEESLLNLKIAEDNVVLAGFDESEIIWDS